MANDWLDKAKAAAMNIAKDAQAAAKSANLGEMMDKTKAMASQAADSVMAKKEAAPAKVESTLDDCNARLAKVASLMLEIKDLLNKQQVGETKAETKQSCTDQLAKIESMMPEVKDLLNKK